jgi:hypothetical protein
MSILLSVVHELKDNSDFNIWFYWLLVLFYFIVVIYVQFLFVWLYPDYANDFFYYMLHKNG